MKIKKIISILLCLVIFVSMTPGVLSSAASGTYRTEGEVKGILDSILANECKPGSYFTYNQEKCGHNAYNKCNKNCSLSKIITRSDISTAIKNSGINKSNFYSDCYTCQAFASYCYTRCFNVPAMGTANGIKASSNYTVIGTVTDKNSTSVKNLVNKAKVGDLIFVYNTSNGAKTDQHWYVVYSVNASNITVIDNNGNSTDASTKIGTIRKTDISYSTLAKKQNVTLRRSNFLKTSNDPVQDTAVTKWALSVSNITETSAVVRADISCTPSKLSKVGLQMGTSTSNMKSVASWSVGTVLTYCSVKCDGTEAAKLSPNTTYYYRFYVLRTDGNYEYSPTSNFKTKETVCSSHTYDGGTVTKKATCTTDGTIVYKCTKCGATKSNTINALGHKMVIMPKKAATCTETGLTEGKYCSVCNAVLVAQKEVAALGHKIVTMPGKAATCTETGLTEGKYCSVCNVVLVEQQEVLALGHQYNGDNVCDNCGATEEVDYNTNDCNCNCHKSGIANFFFKFALFFQKLFGTNKTCDCGAAHY